ncbi:MAG: hypothetical protein KGI38_09495 [Thaumarchaeota archaeon]|nr:hypothetical protein [Nitrososphaerota archaeon]
MARVRFTRHAEEKFEAVHSYGFNVPRSLVERAISAPDHTARRGVQTFSTVILDDKFGLRVVHEERKGIIVVMPFYPIERKRIGL